MIRIMVLFLASVMAAKASAQKETDAKRSGVGSEVRVHLSFNQERFAPGDTVWFKAYLLDRDLSPIMGRHYLECSIVTPANEVQQHFFFGLADGVGFNQFVFPDNAEAGIYLVTAYTDWMKNLDPSPIFSKEITVVDQNEVLRDVPLPETSVSNTNLVNVDIRMNEGGFATRNKTELTIHLSEAGKPIQGEFLVKVLSDEITGDDVPFEQQLILTSAIATTPKSSVPFFTDLSMHGKAYSGDDKPLPAGTTLVFYLQHNDIILQSHVLPGGKFILPIRGVSGTDQLVAFAEVKSKNVDGLKIEWEKSLELPTPPASHEGTARDRYGSFANTKKLIDKSFDFYATSHPMNSPASLPVSKSPLEERLGGTDVNVDVQKYVTFATMVELIREVIPSLQSRTFKGRTTVKVSLREPMAVATADPLYIIDGIVTRNTEYFLALKPADVAVVRIVNSPQRLLPLGLIGKNGVVIVETLKSILHPPAELWQLINGISRPVSFKSKAYSSTDNRPDLRSTIFWAPTIQTDASGKAAVEFYHSDNVGIVTVRVEGFTKDRLPFSAEKKFQALLGKR